MSSGSGGIGGLPPSPAAECEPGPEDCSISHSATGWCNPVTGAPVILLVQVPCDGGDPVITTIDAATGAPIPNGPVVPCGDRDWEVSTLCDIDQITGQVIATVIQIFEWDETTGTLVRTLERADNPGVPYVPLGQLETCSGGQLQAVHERVCGNTAGVFRQLIAVFLTDTHDGTVRFTYFLDAEGNVVLPNLGEVLVVGDCPGSGSPQVKEEDTPHNSGDFGAFVLGVRNDDGATILTDADGDYSGLAVDDRGRLGVTDLGQSLSVDVVGGAGCYDANGTRVQIGAQGVVGGTTLYSVPPGFQLQVSSVIISAGQTSDGHYFGQLVDGVAGPIRVPIRGSRHRDESNPNIAQSFCDPLIFNTAVRWETSIADFIGAITIIGRLI